MATIALDNLKPQDPLKLQTLPQDTTDYASIINSAVGNPMELDQQVQGQETQVQSSLNTLSNLMQEGAGIGSQQLAMENQAGISQQQKEVQDLTNQLNSIRTQANVIPMQIQQESAGRGRTEAGIAPLQTAELRNNAIQALTVGAQLQAKQGNLALAQSQIDRAIELKYRDIENRTKLAELNYNRNKETLERIDKKRADALGYAIQKQKEKDAENKANELAIQNMIVEATPNAPASVIANARKLAESGASRVAIAQSLGIYGGDYLKSELLREQLKQARTKTSTINADGREVVTQNGVELVKVTPKEIQDLNDTQIAKNSLVSLVDNMINSIDKYGTQVLFGAEAGTRSGAKTNLLLAMKNLEKTGALDKGTIDVLSGTIPESEFFATEAAQKAALQQLRNTVVNKTDEYINSYKGTTAEVDPRTKRIYEQSGATTITIPQGVSGTAASYAQSTMTSVNNVNNQVNTQQAYSGYDTGVKK